MTLRPYEVNAAMALKARGLLDFGAGVSETVATLTVHGRDIADLLRRGR